MNYKRACNVCGGDIRYTDEDKFIICPACGNKKPNPHYGESQTTKTNSISKQVPAKEKAQNNAYLKSGAKAAVIYNAATADKYNKTTRIMLYVIIAIVVVSMSIYGIVNSCSYYGTYYRMNYSEDSKVIRLEELNKMKITGSKITYYVPVDKVSSDNLTSYKKYGYKLDSSKDYYYKEYDSEHSCWKGGWKTECIGPNMDVTCTPAWKLEFADRIYGKSHNRG